MSLLEDIIIFKRLMERETSFVKIELSYKDGAIKFNASANRAITDKLKLEELNMEFAKEVEKIAEKYEKEYSEKLTEYLENLSEDLDGDKDDIVERLLKECEE